MAINPLNLQLGASYTASHSQTTAPLQQKTLQVNLAQDDQVTISSEGQAQLARSNGQVLHQQANAKSNGSSAAAEEESTDPVEKLAKKIKELQERLEEIRQELAQLTSDKSEAAEQHRDELRTEQRMVSAQLMQATNQKAKLEEMQSQG
ncbi:hypothetical protein L9G15_07595 [Shewanella sp. A3A]|nr:hypothetical protein [Shewanella ferrihydritica]